MQQEPVILSGQFELTIDEKNRLLIPSPVRQRLVQVVSGKPNHPEGKPDNLFAKIGSNGKLHLYAETTYEQVVRSDPATIAQSSTQEIFNMLHFAMAELLSIDGSGRVVLPASLISDAGLGKEVTLLGVKDHIQVWCRQEWREHKAKLIAMVRQGQINAMTPPNVGASTGMGA